MTNPFTAKAKARKPNPFSVRAKSKKRAPASKTNFLTGERICNPKVYVHTEEAREKFSWLRNGMRVNVTYPFDPAQANGMMNKTGIITLRGDFFDVKGDNDISLGSIPLSFKWPEMKIKQVKPKRKRVKR